MLKSRGPGIGPCGTSLAMPRQTLNEEPPSIYCDLSEFEKWRAIRASFGSMGGVLAWVACLRGQCGWRACVLGAGGVLTWGACYYYSYIVIIKILS